MGTGTGAGMETRAVAEMGTGAKMGTWMGMETGSERVEATLKRARNRTRVVDAIRHFNPHTPSSLQTGGGVFGH